jgi:hypothetical protein
MVLLAPQYTARRDSCTVAAQRAHAGANRGGRDMTETKAGGIAKPATASLIAKRTAILIVHGVGQQEKYQTVGDFAAGLVTRLEAATGTNFALSRRLRKFSCGIESILRIAPADGPDDGSCHVDIVEYFYQPALQRKVALSDVVDWLIRTADHIRALYRTNEALRREISGAGVTASGGLGQNYMLYNFAVVVPVLVWAVRLARLLQKIPAIGGYLKWPAALINWIIGHLLDDLIVNFAGDVTAYTAIDAKEKLHEVRGQVLGGCVTILKELLTGTGPGIEYDQVVLAGHSLGSVVTYDAASLIGAEAEADADALAPAALRKLVGYVTFGSPLDKVAMCFWPFETHARDNGTDARSGWVRQRSEIRQMMLEHFHGMRGLSPRLTGHAKAAGQRPLEHVIWLNFYHPKDIIAGSLDAYRGVTNIQTYADDGTPEYTASDQKFPGAHSFYWYDPHMHDTIVSTFLTDDVSPCFEDGEKFAAKLAALRALSKKDLWGAKARSDDGARRRYLLRPPADRRAKPGASTAAAKMPVAARAALRDNPPQNPVDKS